jgi:hypothetical protein
LLRTATTADGLVFRQTHRLQWIES